MRIAIAALLIFLSNSTPSLAGPDRRAATAAKPAPATARTGAVAPGPAGGVPGAKGTAGACPVVPAPVLKTGQVTAFGPESDGASKLGADPSFQDNGDGTITDQRTGLVWEKKSNDGSVHDLDNVYAWGQSVSPYSMDGPVVSEFLAALNTKPCFAGQCDWRVPNLRELQTLANYERLNPATWPDFNRECKDGCTVLNCSCTSAVPTWTSTTHRLSPRDAWAIHFANGQSAGAVKTRRSGVRAVRGGR